MNIWNLLSDIERYGSLWHMWKGNYHGEKYVQIAKNEFKNKKENSGEKLMQKLNAKKIMTHMTGSSDACNSGLDIDTNDHAIKDFDAFFI